MSTADLLDSYLAAAGPLSLTDVRVLDPDVGEGGVVFPPTFARDEGEKGSKYVIDQGPNGQTIVCLDGPAAQANRIEPVFKSDALKHLVPQIVVTAPAGRKPGFEKNLVDVSHRAADVFLRCTPLQARLSQAWDAVKAGDHGVMAKIAPTTLLFGAWDSRVSQVKVPRLVTFQVHATGVWQVTRPAQYTPTVNYVEHGLIDPPANKKVQDEYAAVGFSSVPSANGLGGVVVGGQIKYVGHLNLAVLRLLRDARGEAETRLLRRYVLGLALVAFTRPFAGNLRQGCLLVQSAKHPPVVAAVYADGTRAAVTTTPDEAVALATAAAAEFGVGPGDTVAFDPELTKTEINRAVKKEKGRGAAGDQDAPAPDDAAGPPPAADGQAPKGRGGKKGKPQPQGA
jgi:CRISPR-associated protein Csb1